MSEDPSSDSTKRERERAGAGQVALVSTPAERGSECDGGRRAVSEPAVARAAASAGERVRRMHTEMPWLRSGWCGRSGGVAWVHAATRLREREQMASERAVPSATEKEFNEQNSLSQHTGSTQVRHNTKRGTVAGAPTRRRRGGRRGEGGNRPHPYDAHPGTPRQPTPPSQAQSPCAPPPLHACPPSSPRGAWPWQASCGAGLPHAS